MMKSLLKTGYSDNSKILYVIIVAVCCAVPFLNKPFHIDDPLFIWAAQNIQAHPGDFYGFNVNWYGADSPMSQVTKNPPLASYYIAGIASITGWNEIGIHLGFLIITLCTAIGMYVLAKMFCSNPLEAVLAGMLTPVFLVSSTSVMCDMMMLCFWVWSVILWVQGIKTHHTLKLLISAFLVSACALTKYFGINLIFLLLVYTVAQQRRISKSIAIMLIPTILLGGYHLLTYSLYGRGLLFDAASYATYYGTLGGKKFPSILFIGSAFAGGCFITILFYTLRLWQKRGVLLGIGFAASLILLLFSFDNIGRYILPQTTIVKLSVVFQFSLMIVSGISILALIVADFLHHRNADSLLLALWALGTMLFATIINWSVNGRSFLPMAPAVGILIMRRIEYLNPHKHNWDVWNTVTSLVPATCIALLVTFADYSLANTMKKAATDIAAKYRDHIIWFQGHWGFQYYMESFGGKPIDFEHSKLSAGSIIVVPKNNTGFRLLPNNIGGLVETLEFDSFPWLSPMNIYIGAGFYSDVWGPLPYLFGVVPNEKYFIVQVGLPENSNLNVPIKPAY